jgi:hypothetical protein
VVGWCQGVDVGGAATSGAGGGSGGFVGLDPGAVRLLGDSLRLAAGRVDDVAAVMRAGLIESGLVSSTFAELDGLERLLSTVGRVVGMRADVAEAYAIGRVVPAEALGEQRHMEAVLSALLLGEVLALFESLTPEEVVEIVADVFDEIDAAGRDDGRLTREDLAAYARRVGSGGEVDVRVAAAVLRLTADGTLFGLVDTGLGRHAVDGKISKDDLRVAARGLDGVSLTRIVAALDVAVTHVEVFDTAAHGGDVDGRFSVNDLKAALRAGGLDPVVADVARFLVDHQGLLPLVDSYAKRERHVLARLATGVWGAAGEVAGVKYLLDGDPVGYLKSRWEMAKGAGAGSKDLVVGLMELARLDPRDPRNALDPVGYAKRLKSFGAGLVSMVSHPGDALAALTDLETLEDKPSRWVGKQIPDLVLTITTAGSGKAAAAGGKVTKVVVHTVDVAEDVADVADAADTLGDTSRVVRDRAKLTWTDGDHPAPPSSAAPPPTTPPARAATEGAGVPQAEIDAIGETISPQGQARHIEGTPQWTARGEGGYFKSSGDAQAVLDAVKSGDAQILGRTANGQLLVRYDGIVGFNNNAKAGFVDQPTNVFIVKGTTKVSVVPTSPGATAK